MERERKEKALKTAIPLSLVLLLSIGLFAFALPVPLSPDVTPWDFQRLDEIWMVEAYPETVTREKALACQIDVYVDTSHPDHVSELSSSPYNWNVSMTELGGLQMAYMGLNCRDDPPDSAGKWAWYHNRTTDFELYPLNLPMFRLALACIIGRETKEKWIGEAFEYICRPLAQMVPAAMEYWVVPYLEEYPKDWTLAVELLVALGFTREAGSDGKYNNDTHPSTDDKWTMPNGKVLYDGMGTSGGNGYCERYAGLDLAKNQMYGIFVLCPGDLLDPPSHSISQKYVAEWNRFFMGVNATGKTDASNTALFIDEPDDDNARLRTVPFENRDHDIHMQRRHLPRNPSFLFDYVHEVMDVWRGDNSPGLYRRDLNDAASALKNWQVRSFSENLTGSAPRHLTSGDTFDVSFPPSLTVQREYIPAMSVITTTLVRIIAR